MFLLTSIFLIQFLKSIIFCKEENDGNIVNIIIFGEGRCKDTTYWFNWHLIPIWKRIKSLNRLNIDYHPFGIKTKCEQISNKDFSCECHHGERECLLNQLQSCVINKLPKFEDYIDYVSCIQGKENITDAADNCFNNNSIIIDRNTMLNCAQSQQGRSLFQSHEKYKRMFAPTNDWVPWILINGKRYKEGEDDFWQFLCDRFLKPRPYQCPRKKSYK